MSLWDSTSTLGDSDNSSSRWDTEEVPAFPRPCCAMISPRLPKRQRTLEKQDMMEMMMMNAEQEVQQQDDNDIMMDTTAADDAVSSSASTPVTLIDNNDNDDKPKQQMAPPRLPRRQLTNMVGNYYNAPGGQSHLARMRFQSLMKQSQQSRTKGEGLFRSTARARPMRSATGMLLVVHHGADTGSDAMMQRATTI